MTLIGLLSVTHSVTLKGQIRADSMKNKEKSALHYCHIFKALYQAGGQISICYENKICCKHTRKLETYTSCVLF